MRINRCRCLDRSRLSLCQVKTARLILAKRSAEWYVRFVVKSTGRLLFMNEDLKCRGEDWSEGWWSTQCRPK